MKKVLSVSIILSIFLVFSCASDDVENVDDLDVLNKKESFKTEEINDEILPSLLLKEPEDFEEPVVRDLEVEIPEITKIDEKKNTISTETKDNPITKEQAAENKKEEIKTPVESVKKEEVKKTEKTEQNKVSKPETQNTKIAENKKEEKKPATPSVKEKTETKIPEIETKENEEKQEETVNPLVDTEKDIHLPSRKVTVNTNETLTVRYPGFGWIYLGSDAEYNNLESTGRKIDNDETVYTLTAKKAGTQLHHFYKVDQVTGDYIDDYLEVTVTENIGSVYTIVKVPDYKEIIPEQPEKPAVASTKKNPPIVDIEAKEVKPTEKRNYEVYTPELTDDKEEIIPEKKTQPVKEEYIEALDADDLLDRAKSLFNEKKYVESQKYLTSFMEIATQKRDEGLFLQGQIFEQDGSTKNIKEAISTYKSIVDNYPDSYYWDDANKRIIYLNRFYIQIR